MPVGKITCIDMKQICVFYAISGALNVTAQVTQIVQVARTVITNGPPFQYVHKFAHSDNMRIISIRMLTFTTHNANYASHAVYNATSITQIVVAVKAQNQLLPILTQDIYIQ